MCIPSRASWFPGTGWFSADVVMAYLITRATLGMAGLGLMLDWSLGKSTEFGALLGCSGYTESRILFQLSLRCGQHFLLWYH